MLIREVHKPSSDAELLLECSDPELGYRGFVVIHSTVRGPALGGIRRWQYPNGAAALDDAASLARSMSYKSALAGLPFGGGKSVVWDSGAVRRQTLYHAHARAIEQLNGQYIGAEDVGTTHEDLMGMRAVTRFLAGVTDPAPWTARSVLRGIQAAAVHRWGSADLLGRTVALQGCGAVGTHLARALHEAGASLLVADTDGDRVRHITRQFRASAVSPADILAVRADVLAPCALGGVLTAEAVSRLQVEIVAGAANNQLGDGRAAQALAERGILYVPDYVINVGGLMTGGVDLLNWSPGELEQRVDAVYDTTRWILDKAAAAGVPPVSVADLAAMERLELNCGRVRV